MSATSRVGTAMAAGYFLGRFKKLRLALLVGSALASEDARTAGANLLMRGPAGLAAPLATKAGKGVASQLAQAGRQAAVNRAGGGVEALAERISRRTAALTGQDADQDEDQDEAEDQYDEEEPEDEYEDEPEDEAEEYEDEEEDDDEEEEEEDEEEDDAEEDEYEDEVPAQRSPRRRRSASPVGGRS
jgi:hypothetical protein